MIYKVTFRQNPEVKGELYLCADRLEKLQAWAKAANITLNEEKGFMWFGHWKPEGWRPFFGSSKCSQSNK